MAGSGPGTPENTLYACRLRLVRAAVDEASSDGVEPNSASESFGFPPGRRVGLVELEGLVQGDAGKRMRSSQPARRRCRTRVRHGSSCVLSKLRRLPVTAPVEEASASDGIHRGAGSSTPTDTRFALLDP